MRRLGQLVFHGLATLSLVLFLATMWLWVRSHWEIDEITRDCSSWSGVFYSDRGVLLFGFDLWDDGTTGANWEYVHVPVSKASDGPILGEGMRQPLARFGFAFTHNPAGHLVFEGYRLYLPHWLICCGFVAVPAYWYWRPRRKKHAEAVGQCLACGYNLTGNASGVCPECGTVIQGVVQADW